ncbi:MAG: Flp pilus assembly complex ATPase component TadA, partial [Elusimicrobia bacterium]|nr:Flp pilus assembly complex ATPase component TadA [Elusimicrobiota bacterium]
DPIEYELLSGAGAQAEMGVTQVQIQSKIGLTFAAGLRAALRQDPDVIMLGEIRDQETAEIAMKAAMTGHLVLSTLHTNDAPSALSRLRDIGVEPYLTASALIGVLAQRLVRVLCADCKERYRPPQRALRNIFPERQDLDRAEFYRPRGCPRCSGTGYRGRAGIFELLEMNDELRASLRAGGAAGVPAGRRTMRQSGMELVFAGRTTVEEVLRTA